MCRSQSASQKILSAVVAALLAVACNTASARAADFAETTTVYGKIPVDLAGTWLLLSHTRLGEGKFRNYPQLITVSREGEAGLTLNLLDRQLPKEMSRAIKTANEKLTPWTPSPKELGVLAKQWSKLPPATDKTKDVMAGDVAYARMRYDLSVPDKYAEAFPKQDDALKSLLAESGFTIYVVEGYRPLPVPEGKNVAQVIERKTVYVVRSANEKLVQGPQLSGFLAAGVTSPLPFAFGGDFTMYRLAGPAKNGGPPAKSAAK